ncbi:hypothetical protein OSB04_030714 [Centaurea solstitialis]|uniref:Protein kinase domain-containing protein n=1 Tax=Centaurea solstitialis TaxID=347529 RepID=A0AA38W7F9_9ASTR|nr:hypothetical protein OSB04_030714 [Centaurea solstitialis]
MAFFDEFQHLKIQLEDIKSATDNFANDSLIGKGGFGKVYKGEIAHSRGRSMVAFKRLDSKYGQGNSEFWREIMMLSRYTHENLISLLGYCDEGGDQKILVYEYASNGSLDRHLGATALTWMHRLKICLAAAKGLSYLHDPKGTQQRVLHRDIKSSNILLDENWNAKVSDLGLSKIGPANQQHSVLVSNIVGTFGYLDPLYMEMGLLTKESDIYSFGVVLFEVLCGRLCYECSNRQSHTLVRMWKKSYKNNKLDEIIFEHLLQQMDPSSLKTFSNVAYQCLHKSREQRPTMAHVVQELETAVQFQEISEGVERPKDYERVIRTATPPLVYSSKEELSMLLHKGILVNKGKTWFSLNKNGEHCEMISAAECLLATAIANNNDRYIHDQNSRFGKVGYLQLRKINVHARAQFLSPRVTYTVNLVFRPPYTDDINSKEPVYVAIVYKLDEERESSIAYIADRREDGWLMVQFYQFTSDTKYFDLRFQFEATRERDHYSWLIEGIEFQPMEKVEHEVLEEEMADMHPISDSDTNWEQKLPNDYEKIIKWSKDSVRWTTKKELYFLLCNGFLINKGEEWLSLAKNGKKCPILSSRVTLVKSEWSWKPLPESRFKEVAFNRSFRFSIICKMKSPILSPQTAYGCYLVYKITENHSSFVAPVEVVDKEYRKNDSHLAKLWFIYLLSPQNQASSSKDDQNTHHRLTIPKIKGLPQLRNDGWMEVRVWEFQTGATTEMISMYFKLRSHASGVWRPFDGLIVQGIEFKPL